jgi:hypothetical protein
MNDQTHETVPTQFVEAAGIRFAYRRFGKVGGLPLLLLNYFAANMEACAVRRGDIPFSAVRRSPVRGSARNHYRTAGTCSYLLVRPTHCSGPERNQRQRTPVESL